MDFRAQEGVEETAIGLLSQLRACLAEACRPLLTSDELPHYAMAILRVFDILLQPRRKGDRDRFPKPRPAA